MSIEILPYDGKTTLVSRTSTLDIFNIDDVKNFARIDDTALSAFDYQNNQLLSGMIDASIEYFEDYTGRYLTPATLQTSYSMKSFFVQANIELPYTDVTVNAITFYDSDDTPYVLSGTYDVDSKRGTVDIYDTTIPLTLRTFNNFVIEYNSSMFASASAVTDDIKVAIQQDVTHKYENRESVMETSMNVVPNSAMSTFNRYKSRKV